MSEFKVTGGSCGEGTARYAAGLLTLPDGRSRAVEDIRRIATPAAGTQGARWQADVVGTLRGVLPTPGAFPLPLRIALSSMRAGLGAIEDGLRPDAESKPVEIVFDDAILIADMPPTLEALIRRDREVVLGAIARTRPEAAASSRPKPAPSEPAQDEAAQEQAAEAGEPLTSIFRYEKRNGRLRRVAESGKPKG